MDDDRGSFLAMVAAEFFTLILDGQMRLAYDGGTLRSFRQAVSFEQFCAFIEQWKFATTARPNLQYGRQVTGSCIEATGTIAGVERDYLVRVLVDEEEAHSGIAAVMITDPTEELTRILPPTGFELHPN